MRGLLLVLAVTLGLTLRASATPPDPAVYLTENLTAVATSPAISAMEQALLDRIDASPALAGFRKALAYLEQPIAREAALARPLGAVAERVPGAAPGPANVSDGYIAWALEAKARAAMPRA